MNERLFIESFFPESGLADPHALVEGDDIYVICGHDESPYTIDTWRMDKWIILKSNNLTDWEQVGEILPTDTYIGDEPNCWAGNLKKKNDKYYWFFSNKFHNIGVLVADKPEGPYIDVLGHPLVDKNNAIGTKPYDPVVYYEGDDWYIVFGAGKYMIATLADDLLSLEIEPKFLEMLDEKGNHVAMGDKPSLFKRNDLYYLISGGRYGISKNLFGPYKYQGYFAPNSNEHNDFFIYKDKDYMTCEFPETSFFYRGVGIVEIQFNEDGTIKDPKIHKLNERKWKFEHSTRGYHALSGTTLEWISDSKSIKGVIHEKEATIESPIWPAGITFKENPEIELKLKNQTDATQLELIIATVDKNTPNRFKYTEIDWNEATSVIVDIAPNSNDFLSYIVKLEGLGNQQLKRFRIKPSKNADTGEFYISEINIL